MAKAWNKRGWVVLALLMCYLVACTTATHDGAQKVDRGIRFPHDKHKEDNECATCHDTAAGGAIMPTHDVCSACHDIDVDNPTPETCGMCHTREDYSIEPIKRLLPEDVKFEHGKHVDKEIACDTCHPNPDKAKLPAQALKPFCMDCHGQTDAKLNECSVCHTQISKDTVPAMRGGVKIAHDAPEIWKRQHGRESLIDPAFCALCHDDEASCEECHRKNAPDNHTVAWRRTGHGFHATMDRQKCAVCHEEDSCIQCHQNTRPASHRRASWGAPINGHCVNCHFPAERTNCTVCHETIEHECALPSPHTFGAFPANCGMCHPAGVPYLAPHPNNSTVSCGMCH